MAARYTKQHEKFKKDHAFSVIAMPVLLVYASNGTMTAYSSRQSVEIQKIEETAWEVQKAFNNKDLDALAKVCKFPLVNSFENGELIEIENRKVLLDFDSSRIFTTKLSKAIAATNLAKLEEGGTAGVYMEDSAGVNLHKFKGKWMINSIYSDLSSEGDRIDITDLKEAALTIQKSFTTKIWKLFRN